MKWLQKMRAALIRDVAAETVRQLHSNHYWQEFLPPVVVREDVYLVTKNGTIYKMRQDHGGYEMIMKVSEIG